MLSFLLGIYKSYCSLVLEYTNRPGYYVKYSSTKGFYLLTDKNRAYRFKNAKNQNIDFSREVQMEPESNNDVFENVYGKLNLSESYNNPYSYNQNSSSDFVTFKKKYDSSYGGPVGRIELSDRGDKLCLTCTIGDRYSQDPSCNLKRCSGYDQNMMFNLQQGPSIPYGSARSSMGYSRSSSSSSRSSYSSKSQSKSRNNSSSRNY